MICGDFKEIRRVQAIYTSFHKSKYKGKKRFIINFIIITCSPPPLTLSLLPILLSFNPPRDKTKCTCLTSKSFFNFSRIFSDNINAKAGPMSLKCMSDNWLPREKKR